MEQYLYGFYTSRPFWAESAIDLPDYPEAGWFLQQMSEGVFELNNDELFLRICRDGQILIKSPRLEERYLLICEKEDYDIKEASLIRSEYLDLLNSFHLFLDAAFLEIDSSSYFNLYEITDRDMFRLSLKDGQEMFHSVAIESFTSTHQNARYISSYRPNIPIKYDIKISSRRIVSREALELASKNLFTTLNIEGGIKQLASYAKSLSEYKNGSYGTSIVLSWFIIEYILNKLWKNKLLELDTTYDDGSKRISSKRLEILTGNSFSAAITSHSLELLGAINISTLNAIEDVRKNRNKLVHQAGFKPSATEASFALSTARDMIKILWRISFTPNLGYSSSNL